MHPLLWVGFAAVVLVMMALDLGVFHRKAHTVGFRESLAWTAVWIALALLFNVWIYLRLGGDSGLEFFTGYLIEYSLSVDNIFVFILVFSYFRVASEYQHRVLFWGVLGALVMRLVFILVGAALISRFEWILYLFGVFLIYSGVRMAQHKDVEVHPEHNPVLRLVRRIIPVSHDMSGGRFFVRQGGRRVATTLFVVLVLVETTDVIFAFDSIPAIFGITRNPFIVYTSNVFAIMGLRSLYFSLAGIMRMFHLLRYGLAAILVFVGLKMLAEYWIHLPIFVSLGVVAAILALSVAASLHWPATRTRDEKVPSVVRHEEAEDTQHPNEVGRGMR